MHVSKPIPILEAVLALGQPALLDEASAARALALARWGTTKPRCPICGMAAAELVFPNDKPVSRFLCDSEKHDFNVFHGTPLEKKRRVSARAMLFALREMASSHRSISARELGRLLGLNHVTLWRHLHVLRSLLPSPPAVPTDRAATVQVCARNPRPRSKTIAAHVLVGSRRAVVREVQDEDSRSPRTRLIGESIRTWLSGTFHGVTARHLPRYLREYSARALPAFAIVAAVLNTLLVPTTVTVSAAPVIDEIGLLLRARARR